MENRDNVYSYILGEETAYQTTGVPVVDGYEFKMYEHIRLSTLYKNGQLDKGNDGNKPIKNIIRPILNVAYRSEGFDVKDINPFVNDPENYYKSFLVKKYHDKWARKNDIDTEIDNSVESYVDYGLILAKNTNDNKPEIVPMQRIAFCDQTDILSGAICEKHSYSPDQLDEFRGVWDDDEIDKAIIMAKSSRSTNQQQYQEAKTPGKYVVVYELHGVFPETWLDENGDPDNFVRQLHIITFYKDDKDQRDEKTGITLYKGRESKLPYKALKRDPIYGRACGYGGIEELIEPQVWTTYNLIQIKKITDATSDIIIQTEDTAFQTRNRLTDREPGEVVVHKPGMPLSQVNLQPVNVALFDRLTQEWQEQARTTGSANDAQLGVSPSSGTPFALQNLVTATGQGIHEYRRGKIATFWGEIYRDWILPKLAKDMNKGDSWLEEVSLEELEYIAENVSTKEANKKAVDMIIKYLDEEGQAPTQQDVELFKETVRRGYVKTGTKKFIKVMKDEISKIPVDVSINIAGKQADLSRIAGGLTNIFRQIFAAPQVLQNPGMANLFNQIVEASGFSPVSFSGLERLTQQLQQPSQGQATLEEPPQNQNNINQ